MDYFYINLITENNNFFVNGFISYRQSVVSFLNFSKFSPTRLNVEFLGQTKEKRIIPQFFLRVYWKGIFLRFLIGKSRFARKITFTHARQTSKRTNALLNLSSPKLPSLSTLELISLDSFFPFQERISDGKILQNENIDFLM